MKKSLLALFILFFSYRGFSQSTLQVHSSEKGMYISHTVSAKENFYSIGRTYNISPKDIAAFNSLEMTHGLSVGQTIQVPLTPANYTQTSQGGTPVYYVVGEKEGLYRVSVNNNKVLLANLRKWNNLSSDAISSGQQLIVGYLTTAGGPATTPVAATPAPAAPPAAQIPAPKPEPKATVQPAAPAAEPKKPEPAPATVPKTPLPVPAAPAKAPQVATGGAGYFKSQFDQQSKKASSGKDVTATAGIFKTTSGWQDGKYYALMDNVEPGTIVRISNPGNNKAVYAKVLGEMSGIRQNQGLEVRISNAAASALEIPETDKFIVKVNY
ncbi:LysM peptidoglycan-binding domain-containing protein [Paraflavisolibacter sp. H34]|uniref:LysM peptidoglycan-binding domain-containing protein n=1 Tax=Huijunlia imazamoxiresistens TaxID=3127457 RepID=UPI0030158FDF